MPIKIFIIVYEFLLILFGFMDFYKASWLPPMFAKAGGDGASSDTPVYRTFIFLDKSQNYWILLCITILE